MTYQPSVVTGMLPCAVVILTVAAGEQRDAMTATAVFVSENPPLLSVSVAGHALTRDLIEQAGEFMVNLPTPRQIDLVRKLGSTRGRQVDKLAEFNVATEAGEKLASPRVAGVYGSLECRVVASHQAATYWVYTAEVLAHSVHEGEEPLIWHRDRFCSLHGSIG